MAITGLTVKTVHHVKFFYWDDDKMLKGEQEVREFIHNLYHCDRLYNLIDIKYQSNWGLFKNTYSVMVVYQEIVDAEE